MAAVESHAIDSEDKGPSGVQPFDSDDDEPPGLLPADVGSDDDAPPPATAAAAAAGAGGGRGGSSSGRGELRGINKEMAQRMIQGKPAAGAMAATAGPKLPPRAANGRKPGANGAEAAEEEGMPALMDSSDDGGRARAAALRARGSWAGRPPGPLLPPASRCRSLLMLAPPCSSCQLHACRGGGQAARRSLLQHQRAAAGRSRRGADVACTAGGSGGSGARVPGRPHPIRRGGLGR